jgi:hypothetical protein
MTPDFEEQVAKYKKIAVAVNAFSSPEVQKLAFEALTGSARSQPPAKHHLPAEEKESANSDSSGKPEPNGEAGQKRRKAVKASLAVDKSLNLRPAGKQAFKDFVADKQPGTNDERNVVTVYYLKELLEVSKATIGQILACYKEADWRVPGNPLNSLQVTASRMAWLDTQDRDDIKLTPQGENTVKFDLPRSKKKV